VLWLRVRSLDSLTQSPRCGQDMYQPTASPVHTRERLGDRVVLMSRLCLAGWLTLLVLTLVPHKPEPERP
jgi:hypothetical protein